MTNVPKTEHYIPIKNYVLAAVIVVVIILLTWYGFLWFKVFRDAKLNESYLVQKKVIPELKLSDVSNVLSEPLSAYYIYISYTGSEDIYNMEKELKEVIDEYSLNDTMYYLNVTDIIEDKDYLDQINKTLGESIDLNKKEIASVPTIIYCYEGKIVDITSRLDKNIMTKGDFQKLLERNQIKKE